jgi:hypothetical protein
MMSFQKRGGLGLRLVPAPHDAEADVQIAFLHECRNDGVERTLVTGGIHPLKRARILRSSLTGSRQSSSMPSLRLSIFSKLPVSRLHDLGDVTP